MKLTEQEKQVVTENHNLIYWFLNSKGLDVEEWYDLMAIELCYAVKLHDPERGSLANYFKLRANGRYIKEMGKLKKKSRIPEEVEYLEDIHFVPVTEKLLDDYELDKWLTDEQREVVDLKLKGYSQTEIGGMLGISQSKVSTILRKVKREYEANRQTDW